MLIGGAFERLFCPDGREFEQANLQKFKCPGGCPGGGCCTFELIGALIKNIDNRATLQVLNTKLRISQNNPICGAEEKQPRLKKQHRLSLE